MTFLSLLAIAILYPITLLGDGCVLIAVALAATVGGRPIIWGASFAFFHATYGLLGTVLAEEIANYSEIVGDLLVLLGTFVLLRHFVHHRLHHQAGGDCSCENHKPLPVKTSAIISTASAFSLHAFASGAILQGLSAQELTRQSLIIIILATSLLIGSLVGAIILIGDKERLPILRSLDKLPSAVTLILSTICALSAHHILHSVYPLSWLGDVIFSVLAISLIGFLTIKVHNRAVHSSEVKPVSIGVRHKHS